jgi:hypothetical protein
LILILLLSLSGVPAQVPSAMCTSSQRAPLPVGAVVLADDLRATRYSPTFMRSAHLR